MSALSERIVEQEEDEERDNAIHLLAEQLLSASLVGINAVAKLPVYDFKYKDVMNATNGDEDFYNAFYEVAKKLINSERDYV